MDEQRHVFTATEAKLRAFVKIGQIERLLQPEFAESVMRARDEGLLELILGGNQEAVQKCGSELIAALDAQIVHRYPLPAAETGQSSQAADQGGSDHPSAPGLFRP